MIITFVLIVVVVHGCDFPTSAAAAATMKEAAATAVGEAQAKLQPRQPRMERRGRASEQTETTAVLITTAAVKLRLIPLR